MEATRTRKRRYPLGTDADRRRTRDLLWLMQFRQGWSIERIAIHAGAHRTTVWRRIRQMEALANAG